MRREKVTPSEAHRMRFLNVCDRLLKLIGTSLEERVRILANVEHNAVLRKRALRAQACEERSFLKTLRTEH